MSEHQQDAPDLNIAKSEVVDCRMADYVHPEKF